jgi:hypothetical protein
MSAPHAKKKSTALQLLVPGEPIERRIYVIAAKK